MYHPFRHLLSLGPSVTMSVEPTPGDKPAWWSPANSHLMVKPGQLQVGRRCAVAHELAHRDLGHSGSDDSAEGCRFDRRQERDADELAARRLITLEVLISALLWTDDPEEVAEACWVTRHMLDVRVETMYGGERKRVAVELSRRRDH